MVDIVRAWFMNGGKAALKRNMQRDPVVPTGDALFDMIASDIFVRMENEDPKVLRWDDEVKPIVGLYDQATKGPCLNSDQA